jgi:thiol:disulfide interchange protein DsbD
LRLVTFGRVQGAVSSKTVLRNVPTFLGVGVLLCAGGVLAAPVATSRHVEASLVAETDAVTPGQPLVVGLRLEMEPGWHTYWRNPGDSGLPTKIQWELPEGFSAGEIQWPRPIRFNTGPLVSYGYHDEVLLPVEVKVPAALPSGEVRLGARASWLECKDVCLPGKADLELTLPVRSSARPGSVAGLFQTARRELPTAGDGWRVSASADEATIALAVAPPGPTTLEEAYFYPLTRRAVDYSKPQELRSVGERYDLVLPRDPNGGPAERLEGVLVGRTGEGPVALEVAVILEEETP